MRNPKAPLFLPALVSAAALIMAALTTKGRGAGNQNNPAAKQKRREMPVVDFASQANDAAAPGRQAKGRRYNLNTGADPSKFRLKESDPEESYELSSSHAPERSAVPAAQSDAVAIGTVTAGEAHLSEDRTGVYSEFTFQVEEVLKDESEQGVNAGSAVIVERRGGAVRFASGKLLRRGSVDETMPVAGGRYVLFLRSYGRGEGLSVVTGYELRDGRVFPLDGVDLPEGMASVSQFAAYEGVAEAAFLQDVRSALAGARLKKIVKLVSADRSGTELSPETIMYDER